MVIATFTTTEGCIEQKTFPNMKDMNEYWIRNYGKYEAIDAKEVHKGKDLRQGRCDRLVTRA